MRFLDIVWKVLGVRVLEPRWHESVRQRLLTAHGPRVETRNWLGKGHSAREVCRITRR